MDAVTVRMRWWVRLATLVNDEEAMVVLDEWGRRRPELVAEDAGGARWWFEQRGVISAPTQ